MYIKNTCTSNTFFLLSHDSQIKHNFRNFITQVQKPRPFSKLARVNQCNQDVVNDEFVIIDRSCNEEGDGEEWE